MRRLLLTLGCVVTVGVSLAVPAPASAASGTYCMLNISTGASRCAATEADLYSGVTALATQYLLGRFFDDSGRSGAFLDIFAAGPCDTNSDKDWQYSNIGNAWNDRVSSFTGYSECQVKIFENDNFGGASLGPLSYSDYVGSAMNDRTTSMQFF